MSYRQEGVAIMTNLYSPELYKLMEDEYRKHGASCNAAQLDLRSWKLNKMVVKYRESQIKDMLLNDFDSYHFADVSDVRIKIEDGEIKIK